MQRLVVIFQCIEKYPINSYTWRTQQLRLDYSFEKILINILDFKSFSFLFFFFFFGGGGINQYREHIPLTNRVLVPYCELPTRKNEVSQLAVRTEETRLVRKLLQMGSNLATKTNLNSVGRKVIIRPAKLTNHSARTKDIQ